MPIALTPDLASVAALVRNRSARRVAGGGAYVVAIDGGVSVGKSTLASQLRTLLGVPPEPVGAHVVATDGFLFPNRVLDARGLAMRKGFPETYDGAALRAFLDAARSGADPLRAPVYSHETYDVLADPEVFACPDVLVLEGLHTSTLGGPVDLTIFVDAAEADIERWYVERFVQLAGEGTGFYASFASWSEPRLAEFAQGVWDAVNAPNLHEHILPNRSRADVVLTKGPDHGVTAVTLRD